MVALNLKHKISSRENYCFVIADIGVNNAIKASKTFLCLLEQNNITIDDPSKVIIGFTFMNWGIANGVWSNLKNATLRRDLMRTSQRAFVLAAAKIIREGEPPEDIAFLAVQIDAYFQGFIRPFYIERVREIERQGYSSGANAILLVSLEWILENTNLKNSDMDKIIHTFTDQSEDFDEITSVALQLIEADKTRKNKGILRRFFGK